MIACTNCVQCSVNIQQTQRSNATHDFNSMCVLTTRKRSSRHALRSTVEPIGIYKRRQRSAQHYHSFKRSQQKAETLTLTACFSSAVVTAQLCIVLNCCNFRRDLIVLCSVYRQNSILQKMHFHLSEFSAAMGRSIQYFGFVKLTIFVLLSYHIVEAKNYCSYCKHHVACNNEGVR